MTTQKPLNVRVAGPQDEEQILKLMLAAHREQPTFDLNHQKMRDKIKFATERRGGVVGVIDGPNGLEGYLLAVMTQFWYTDAWMLEELSNFVHPDYRRSSHAKNLIEFGKWFSEQLGLPFIMSIMSTQRLEAKSRLYRRQLVPVGAVFIHNTGHIDGLLTSLG